ncbi:hypothetical protein ALC57_09863 [Trachymyrmex cornetzi]|uniref:Uncharacterized protein n=1 Tax=Trachymyrmex cornetzi TaxID=471704 RepID=A0A151J4W0_9HYME|nr:hypothetical protein ALC57_09863 [Trachymyrmex cornetzi]
MYVTESSGKQTHSKKNCYYCKKLQSKIARHLETVHSNEEEVKRFIVLSKGNYIYIYIHIYIYICIYERKKILETIRRNGNFQFNTKKVINNGELITCRRPNKKWNITASDFLPYGKCNRCTGCNSKHNKSIMVLGRTIIARTHEVANKILKTIVFPVLRDDEITLAIRYDQLIILYGNELCLKYRLQHQHDIIRFRLRLLGRYLISLRTKNEDIINFASLYDPKFYDVAIAAVNHVAGFDEDKNVYKVPSVAFNLGTYIKHVEEILIKECIKNHDPMKMKLVKDFLKLFRQDYGTSVNRTVLETQMQRKRQKKIILPSTDDIRKLNSYLTEKRQEAYNNLLKQYSYKNWLNLLETTLISVQLFNRRRAEETERILASEFQSYHSVNEETNKDIYESLSAEARKLANKYVRFEIRGKLGRTVPVLLPAHGGGWRRQETPLARAGRRRKGVIGREYREMLELRKDGPFCAGVPGALPLTLLPLRQTERDRPRLPDVFEKRGGESLGWVSATSVDPTTTREQVFQVNVLQYTSDALHVSDSTPLRYFRVFIAGHPLMALVDSGSGRTIFGQESIAIVRSPFPEFTLSSRVVSHQGVRYNCVAPSRGVGRGPVLHVRESGGTACTGSGRLSRGGRLTPSEDTAGKVGARAVAYDRRPALGLIPESAIVSYGRFQDVLEPAAGHKLFPGQSWKMPNVLQSANT